MVALDQKEYRLLLLSAAGTSDTMHAQFLAAQQQTELARREKEHAITPTATAYAVASDREDDASDSAEIAMSSAGKADSDMSVLTASASGCVGLH